MYSSLKSIFQKGKSIYVYRDIADFKNDAGKALPIDGNLTYISFVIPAPQAKEDNKGKRQHLYAELKKREAGFAVFDFDLFLRGFAADGLDLLWNDENLQFWERLPYCRLILKRIEHFINAASEIILGHYSQCICFFVRSIDSGTSISLIKKIKEKDPYKTVILIDSRRKNDTQDNALNDALDKLADIIISYEEDYKHIADVVLSSLNNYKKHKSGAGSIIHFERNPELSDSESIFAAESKDKTNERAILRLKRILDPNCADPSNILTGNMLKRSINKKANKVINPFIGSHFFPWEKNLIASAVPADSEIISFNLKKVRMDPKDCLVLKVKLKKDAIPYAKIFVSPDSARWFKIGDVFPVREHALYSYKINQQIAGDFLFLKITGIAPARQIRWIKLYVLKNKND